MKILLFLTTLLSSFIYKPIYYNDFLIDLCEVDAISDAYTKQSNNKVSFYYMQNYLFTIDSNYYTYVNDESNLYIAYVLENKLYIKIYEDNSKLKKSLVLTENNYLENYIKIVKVDNKFYLFSTISNDNQNDIIVYCIDSSLNILEKKTFIGNKDEEFIDVIYTNDAFYLLLRHDNDSFGEFGLGGVYVLSHLSKDLNVVKNIYFKEEIKEFRLYDAELSLISKDMIYQYDLNLNQIMGFKMKDESFFTSKSICGYYLSVLSDHINIYQIYFDKNDSLNKTKLLKTYNYDLANKYLEEVIEKEEKIYLVFSDGYLDYLYELKIYDLRNFVEEVTYLDTVSDYNKEIYTWFSKIDLVSTSDNLNPEVNGEYEIDYNYGTFSKKAKVKVLEEENVKEGMIYPINYYLYFTGTAFLNNKMIHNNYCITEEGKYKLDLYSNNKELRTINFSVSNNQIEFQDDTYIKSDFSAKVNQNVSLLYSLDIADNLDDIEVIVDDNIYNNYTYKEGIVKLNFAFSESGFYKKVVNTINGIEVNDIITFNVFEEDPIIEFNLNEERKKIKIDYYNEDNNLRMFKLYLDNNLYKTYPIRDTLIVLPHERDYNEVKITLAYDIKDQVLYEKELSTFLLSDTNKADLAKIIIKKQEGYLEEYEILLNDKKVINKIKCEDKVIYENVEEDSFILDVCIIGLSVLSASLIGFILYKKIKDKIAKKAKSA